MHKDNFAHLLLKLFIAIHPWNPCGRSTELTCGPGGHAARCARVNDTDRGKRIAGMIHTCKGDRYWGLNAGR